MMLQAIQRRYNYLPEPALKYLSEKIDIPLTEIYGVATFYKTFSIKPRGRNILSVCLGTACHVREASKVMESVQEKLNTPSGETTQDGRFTVETVRCLGCCSHGPVVKINEEIHSGIDLNKIDKILDEYK
jgi:NADH:ubiquinone oxidoreductase subunit E